MIYVAASSKEIDRAETMIRKLRENGISVSSTWPEQIRAVGDANPIDATRSQRARWSLICLTEVYKSDVLWLLYPTQPTAGAWVELGFALCCAFGGDPEELSKPYSDRRVLGGPKRVITSGISSQRSIFPAIGVEYETDQIALDRLLGDYGSAESMPLVDQVQQVVGN